MEFSRKVVYKSSVAVGDLKTGKYSLRVKVKSVQDSKSTNNCSYALVQLRSISESSHISSAKMGADSKITINGSEELGKLPPDDDFKEAKTLIRDQCLAGNDIDAIYNPELTCWEFVFKQNKVTSVP